MKNRVTLLTIVFTVFISLSTFAQTAYRSIASGDWDNFAIWERTTNVYNPTPTWAPAIAGQVPTSNNIVYVVNGFTVTTAATKSCLNLIIDATSTLNPGATLRVGVASSALGGGFVDTLQVNGTLGAPGSQMALELGTSCKSLWITGTGTINMGRFRPNNGNLNYPGSVSLNAGTGASVIFDKDINFSQSGNYAFTAMNSTPVNDSTSLTILPGRTIILSDPTSYFHNDLSSSATANGKFVYNINGTLDLSAHTSTTGGTKLIPFQNAASTITLNVGGVLKLGAYFKADTIATSMGGVYLNINNGGLVDATLTGKLITGTIGATAASSNIYFVVSGTGALRRTVPADATKIEFNIGTSLTSYSPVTINSPGPSEVYTVSVSDAFSGPSVVPAQSLEKEWSITEQTPGGNGTDTLRFTIPYTIPGPPVPGAFNPLDVIYAYRWNGSAYVEGTLVSKSGGTGPTDPYVARVTGFNAFGSFILSNTPPTTTPVAFVNEKVFQKQNGVQVEFGNATESDIKNYTIEKSVDGTNFTAYASLSPKTNNGGLNSYSYFDAAPNRGNNFYRIKATENTGTVKYSTTLNIRLQTKGIWVNAYPNPVKGGTVNVQLENFEKSIYSIAVFNQVGQAVYTKSINHNGGTATFAVELPASVSKGIYSLQVINASTRVINKIVVE